MTSAPGQPRLHLRRVDSTNERARSLATAGARHGTLVTAGEQTAGRGRQGRTWSAPAGQALLMSVVLRKWPVLLPLATAVAVRDVCGEAASIKWPNDVLIDGRKVAGILIEARPAEGWAVLGIGLNVAVRVEDMPEDLRETAAGLGRSPEDVEDVLAALLLRLGARLTAPAEEILSAYRERDALAGRDIEWANGRGRAAGIDDEGRLVVETGAERIALDAGEVHLTVR